MEELDSNLLTQNPRFSPAGWEFSGGRFMYSRWEHWAGIKQLCPQKVVCCGLRERICFSWLLVQYFFGPSGNGERGNLWKWQRFCNHRKRYPIYKAYLQSDYKFVEYISWQPTPVSLSGESYGQRSLVGQSPWGHKESDMTEHTRVHTYPYNAYNKTAAKGFYYSSILSMKSIVQLSFYITAIFVCGICHTCEISNLVFKLWWVIIYRHNTWIFRLLREVMESATALRFLFSEMHLFSFLFWVLWTGFRGCSRLTGTCMHAQLCLTFFDPMDWNPPGSSVYGIFQARILEWVAIFYFRVSSQPRDWTHVSCVSCTGRWTLYHWAACEAQQRWWPGNEFCHLQEFLPLLSMCIQAESHILGRCNNSMDRNLLRGMGLLALFGHHPMDLPSEIPQVNSPWSFSSKA